MRVSNAQQRHVTKSTLTAEQVKTIITSIPAPVSNSLQLKFSYITTLYVRLIESIPKIIDTRVAPIKKGWADWLADRMGSSIYKIALVLGCLLVIGFLLTRRR